MAQNFLYRCTLYSYLNLSNRDILLSLCKRHMYHPRESSLIYKCTHHFQGKSFIKFCMLYTFYHCRKVCIPSLVLSKAYILCYLNRMCRCICMQFRFGQSYVLNRIFHKFSNLYIKCIPYWYLNSWHIAFCFQSIQIPHCIHHKAQLNLPAHITYN